MTYRVFLLYGEWCRAGGYAETTIQDRRELLMRAEHDLGNLDRATPQQLANWLARPGWSPQTRATYYGHLHGYLLWALRGDRIQTDPMIHMIRPRVPKRSPRPAREEHYRELMRFAEERWRIAVTIARYSGLRAAEIARARREDVDEDDIRVLGKGGRVDMLPMHPEIWRQVKDRPPGRLVLSVRDQPYTPAGISHAFGTRARQLGVPVTLHMFRHLFATSLLRSKEDGGAGANLRIVQELCRHASVATTANYTQVTDRERRNAVFTLAAAA